MSLRGYARHRGVAPSAVAKAIESGRIVRRADGRIDAAEADRSWNQNTRPKVNGIADRPPTSFMVERTRREQAEADLAQMEAAARSGQTISVAVATRIVEEGLAKVREKMLASIGAHARKVIGLRTVGQANAALEAIIYEALAAGSSVGAEIEESARQD